MYACCHAAGSWCSVSKEVLCTASVRSTRWRRSIGYVGLQSPRSVPPLRGRNPGSRLFDPPQGSVIVCKVAGVQHLDTRLVVSVERRHCAGASGFDRVCRVGKPHPEMGHLNCDGTWVQDEGLITEDPRHVCVAFASSIGCQVTLVPRRDEGCVRRRDDKEREIRVWRKIGHLNVHVLNRSEVADRDPSMSFGIEAGHGPRGFNHFEDSAIACCRFCERNYPNRTDGNCQGHAC